MSSQHSVRLAAREIRDAIQSTLNLHANMGIAEGNLALDDALFTLDGLVEQKETLLAAVAEYIRVVKEHTDALADYAEDMDGDAEQIVSSLGFIGNLDRGCLDPDEDSLAQALDVLRDSLPASSPWSGVYPHDTPGLTHGRHCPCSACLSTDWHKPALADLCGMHGGDCPDIIPASSRLAGWSPEVHAAEMESEGQ